MTRARPALALYRGCRICGDIRPGMLALESGVMLCRACASGVSALLRRATSTFLNDLWIDGRSTATWDRPEPAVGPVRDETDLVAQFRARLLAVVRPEDFKAHWDLALAYDEMGLRSDAIMEFATSLDERAPQDMAQGAFDILFGPPRAHVDALERVVLALGR